MGCQIVVFGAVPVQDFNCVVGDDFYVPLNLIDEITGNPEDISGWSFFADISASYAAIAADDPPLIRSKNGIGFTITDGPGGALGWSIPAIITSEIEVGNSTPYGMDIPQNTCVYSIVAIDENGLVKTRKRGTFTFQLKMTSTG